MGPFGNAVITFSPLSTVTNTSADLIFRCQNCTNGSTIPEAFVDDKMTSWVLTSDMLPDYIGNTTQAILPLAGAQITNFTLNAAAARFSNFSKIVRAAGFDD